MNQAENAVLAGIEAFRAGLPVLRPEVVDPLTAAAARALVREGESENTVASYQAGIRYWAAWHQLRFGQPLDVPVSTAAVVQFIVDHVEIRLAPDQPSSFMPAQLDQALVALKVKGKLGPPTLATLLHRISVLSKLHSIREVENPCASAPVRELLKSARKAFARRGIRQDQKDALTADKLRLVLATCDESLKGKRDRALLHFAWSSGGRRRSEAVQASFDNVRRLAPGQFVYTLGVTKTNQSGELRPEDQKPVIGEAGLALEAWLSAARIQSGALFRSLSRGGKVGPALSEAAVREIVKSRCAQAGLGGNYSAHSLRSGFVTEAGRQRVPVGDAMAMSGHHNVGIFMRYYRASELMTSAAANIYASAKPTTSPNEPDEP